MIKFLSDPKKGAKDWNLGLSWTKEQFSPHPPVLIDNKVPQLKTQELSYA